MNKKELNLEKFEKDKIMKHGRLQIYRKPKTIRKGSRERRKNLGNSTKHELCPHCNRQTQNKILKIEDLKVTLQIAKIECDLNEVEIE
jgi:hypothetical protein